MTFLTRSVQTSLLVKMKARFLKKNAADTKLVDTRFTEAILKYKNFAHTNLAKVILQDAIYFFSSEAKTTTLN